MDYFLVSLASATTAALTLFSGFGLGTVLTPMFALFFPIEVAIALTAIVHFLNNLLKLSLFGKHADPAIIVQFGIPALVAALLGAEVLLRLSDLTPLMQYPLGGRECQVHPVKVVVAVLIVFFALFELLPRFQAVSFSRRYLVLGGMISGFFGGLSGHQGALRSAFLAKSGLTKESFLGTGIVIACLVDLGRLAIYSHDSLWAHTSENAAMVLTAVASAFLGTLIATRLTKHVTMRFIESLVAFLLFGIAVGLGSGLL
jgi:uncharacterized membrane protein YfcA